MPARREAAARRPRDPVPRTVAVTGAAGSLGRSVIERLEVEPRVGKVLALDRERQDLALAKAEAHRIDLAAPTARSELASLFDRAAVDVVCHLAFPERPAHATSASRTLEGTATPGVLEACATVGVRKLVLWSVTAVYGAEPDRPLWRFEDEPIVGASACPSMADRAEADREAARLRHERPDMVVTVLRTAPLLGRGFTSTVGRLLERPVVPALWGYDPLVQLLGPGDAVEAFAAAIVADHPGDFNLAAPGVLPWRTVIALAGGVALPLPRLLARPLAAVAWAAELSDLPPDGIDYLRWPCLADPSRAERELGWRARLDIRGVIRAWRQAPAARVADAA